MKFLRCPKCKRERNYKEGLVMFVCPGCQVEMGVVEDG